MGMARGPERWLANGTPYPPASHQAESGLNPTRLPRARGSEGPLLQVETGRLGTEPSGTPSTQGGLGSLPPGEERAGERCPGRSRTRSWRCLRVAGRAPGPPDTQRVTTGRTRGGPPARYWTRWQRGLHNGHTCVPTVRSHITAPPLALAAFRHGHPGPRRHRVGPQRLRAGGLGHLPGGRGASLRSSEVSLAAAPSCPQPPRCVWQLPHPATALSLCQGRCLPACPRLPPVSPAVLAWPSAAQLMAPLPPAVQGPALLPGRPAAGRVLRLRVVPGRQVGGLEPQQPVPGGRELRREGGRGTQWERRTARVVGSPAVQCVSCGPPLRCASSTT